VILNFCLPVTHLVSLPHPTSGESVQEEATQAALKEGLAPEVPM
jgi:hypothetical protein